MPKAAFLALPTYDGRVEFATAQAALQYACQTVDLIPLPMHYGSTAPTCNHLWTTAINVRRQNPDVEWFAMLHADVAPEPLWLDKLIAEANAHNADIVSAVIPLKEDSGRTSTALANWSGEPVGGYGARYPGVVGRLTLRQVHSAAFPRTFGIDAAINALAKIPEDLRTIAPCNALLCNTGCMVVRIAGKVDWSRVHFTLVEGVYDDGKLHHWYLPDDWLFTYRASQCGAKVMATTAVKCGHIGVKRWENDSAWGALGKDSSAGSNSTGATW